MCLLAIKFPICMRNIIVTTREIATIAFFDTGCLLLIVYCFLFGQKSTYLESGQGRARAGKIFQLGVLPPMPPGFVAAVDQSFLPAIQLLGGGGGRKAKTQRLDGA